MQGGLAPVGVLADFLEVEPRYEGVVEDFLRDELNYIVVNPGMPPMKACGCCEPMSMAARRSLCIRKIRRRSFLLRLMKAGTAPPSHSIVPLKHTIRVLDGFGKSLEVILPKLRDGYIVPDPAFARELALENPDAFFLSQNGECFHNVTVTGGKQRAEGPLSMKRELRDVHARAWRTGSGAAGRGNARALRSGARSRISVLCWIDWKAKNAMLKSRP